MVDVVDRPPSDDEDAFPGLYLTALPEQPFLDNDTVLLSSQWRSTTDVLSINLGSKQVQRLRQEGSRGAWSLLAIGNGAQLLFSCVALRLRCCALVSSAACSL